jgi:hypothetical protein
MHHNYDYLTDIDSNSLIFSSNTPSDIPLTTNDLNLTIWNANGLVRQAISTVTDALATSDLIFITETWLLSPNRYPTNWQQYHTYGVPALGGGHRGQMGISLLVNPAFRYPITPLPSSSNFVFACQVSSLLIYCLYLPPSLSDDEFMDILNALPHQTHPTQTNTIFCGDFNARCVSLLGDTRTTTRGTRLADWIGENGYFCWNGLLARGVPTLHSINRVENSARVTSTWSSIVDLFISIGNLINPSLDIHNDSLGSDHLPVTLRCSLPRPAAPPTSHPRLLWKLARLSEEEPYLLYQNLFKARSSTFEKQLIADVRYAINIYLYSQSDYVYPHDLVIPPIDIDTIATKLTSIIHSCLDDSVGRKAKPPGPPGNAWFWTTTLQELVDNRSAAYKAWRDADDSSLTSCAVLRAEYLKACDLFKAGIAKRKRETWKTFCTKLSDGHFSDTTAIVKKFRNNRRINPSFTHPEGPAVAAQTMSNHLRTVFAGDNLPPHRPSAPSFPTGPNLTMGDVRSLCNQYHIVPDLPFTDEEPSADEHLKLDCPFTSDDISYLVRKKLARRKAPGVDHLRTEMLLPILDDLVAILHLLFTLCWIWCQVPKDWCTAQVVPIFKKGDPLQAVNYRPISLTSVFRKLFELCLQQQLSDTAPPLDNVQGGFRAQRSTLDQALLLHEVCRLHTVDHGTPPVLCFLDIKQAYDSVDRNIIWRALETYVSDPMLGLLQNLFDHVHIEVLLGGQRSSSFWPATGVLQGSILSPFLYSIYINTLPPALRSLSRVAVPRLYNGVWINSFLYADDVVIIGTSETMPQLLQKAEEHSRLLGYRWNPSKSVVVNAPQYTGNSSPLKLYGDSLPTANSFNYLGLPFNNQARLDANLLITRNARSALLAMRTSLQALGVYSSSFSRLTSARLYTTFIRPKLEYGLAISLLSAKDIKLLENAQNQCLRICFGGHSKASTAVFKHLTNLPSMRERAEHLVFKNLERMASLPVNSTMIGSLRNEILAAPKSKRLRWPKLLSSSPVWRQVRSIYRGPQYHPISTIEEWREINNDYKRTHFDGYRLTNLKVVLSKPDAPVLLSACRPSLGVDPILTLPMTTWERSRLLRWKMGWLPARPIACRCGHPHASRQHLLVCLDVANRLRVPHDSTPNPLDFVINQLPKVKLPPSSEKQKQHSLYRWSNWWPMVCAIMLEMDMICLPDSEFSDKTSDTDGLTLLNWLLPSLYVQVAPPITSTLYNYM